MKKKGLFLIVLCVLSLNGLHAQQNAVKVLHLTAYEGLSDKRVTAIVKDCFGFIWIGTKDGLNRFDGREFQVFRNDENDGTSLGGNRITTLAFDNDSLLWIGIASVGFSCYDFRTGKFTNFNTKNTTLHSNSIATIKFDSLRNKLWIAQNSYGLQVFDLKSRKFDTDSFSLLKLSFYDVELRDSQIYFGGIGTHLANAQTVFLKRKFVNPASGSINKIFLDANGLIWCGAWDNALHLFDKQTNLIASYIFDGKKEINYTEDEILSIAEDKNKWLWCGTRSSGIYFFDIQHKAFITDIELSPKINSRVNCLFSDDNNRIWIGSENGLWVYDPLQNQFDIVRITVPEDVPTCKVFGRVFTPGNTEFLIAACGLFYKMNPGQPYVRKELFYNNEKQKLVSVFRDIQNRIFIGTNHSLFLFDTLLLELKPIKSNPVNKSQSFYSFKGSTVNEINQIVHHNNTLIASSIYGYYITLVDLERENIYKLIPGDSINVDNFEGLNRKIFIDSKNNFWVCGASKGISKISIPDSIRFSSFRFSDSIIRAIDFQPHTWANRKSGSISSLNDVFDIVENKDGSYWLSTQGHGLVKFNPENDSMPFLSFAGMYKSLHGIEKCNDTSVWIISPAGLLCYNTINNHYQIFDKNNGITETIGGYFFKVPKPYLNVGFDGGYFSFIPDSILRNTEIPRLLVSHLWVMDQVADSLLRNQSLKFHHTKNFFKFYVSANCYSNNNQLQYFYFLEGIDLDWRTNGNSPLITYTNLPHGNFNLKIKAINSDGITSKELLLPIVISPPFYRTFYFYLLLLVSIGSVLYVIYRYRIRQLIKIQEVRNKIARDLHDDIGSTLGSIHLYSQIANAKLSGNMPEEIKAILSKIESSSLEIIDRTGDAVWAVKASNDTLKNLILRMESYAASLFGATGILFTIDFEERIANTKLEMTKRKNIFLIYKEAVHNIIKYAGCTEVTIVIHKVGEKLRITITDNGKGFVEGGISPHNGNGIQNMKSRTVEINGQFKISSQPGIGTVIEIIV